MTFEHDLIESSLGNMTSRIKTRLLLFLLALGGMAACAETVYFKLENVLLASGRELTGTISWTYSPGNFEDGEGEFVSLQVPYSTHDHTDLDANIDLGESIEITLPTSAHDDGVDINLILATPLTASTSSSLVIGEGESKYEIGGNGFHSGNIITGKIVPVYPDLKVTPLGPSSASISWDPALTGWTLQESLDLSPGS
jgi:hypothetical protein